METKLFEAREMIKNRKKLVKKEENMLLSQSKLS
jgi:hypothetical protein